MPDSENPPASENPRAPEKKLSVVPPEKSSSPEKKMSDKQPEKQPPEKKLSVVPPDSENPPAPEKKLSVVPPDSENPPAPEKKLSVVPPDSENPPAPEKKLSVVPPEKPSSPEEKTSDKQPEEQPPQEELGSLLDILNITHDDLKGPEEEHESTSVEEEDEEEDVEQQSSMLEAVEEYKGIAFDFTESSVFDELETDGEGDEEEDELDEDEEEEKEKEKDVERATFYDAELAFRREEIARVRRLYDFPDDESVRSQKSKTSQQLSSTSSEVEFNEFEEEEEEEEDEEEEVLNRRQILERDYKDAIELHKHMTEHNSNLQNTLAHLMAKTKQELLDHTTKYDTLKQNEAYIDHFSRLLKIKKQYTRAKQNFSDEKIRLQKEIQEQRNIADESLNKLLNYRKSMATYGNTNKKSSRYQLATRYVQLEKQRWMEANKLYLENLVAKRTLARVLEKLKQKEKIGAGLVMADFDQLKLENYTNLEEIEERNEQCNLVLKSIKATSQKLIHVKEKLQYFADNNEIEKQVFDFHDQNAKTKRYDMKTAKKLRAKARHINTNLKEKSDLLGYPTLLADFEVKIDYTNSLKKQLAEMTVEYANRTNEVKHLYQKIAIEEERRSMKARPQDKAKQHWKA